METVRITKLDDVFVKVHCEKSTAYELKDRFTFKAENYRFHPKYKARIWDGNISLFSLRDYTVYAGLVPHIKDFCKSRDYNCEVEETLELQDEFSVVEAKEFISTLSLPDHFELRDYQIESFVHCVRNKRSLFVSPTGSGKSMIIYWLVRYYSAKTLIIVDSLNLLRQMYSDFESYGFDSEKNVHLVFAKQEKTSKKPIYITTWQSAHNMPKKWFDQFDVVVGDEAHKFKATALKKIMESLTSCEYRFGFTGSLDNSTVNKLTLEGLFGEFKQIKTTKNLIDEGHLSNLLIKAIVLTYPDDVRKDKSKLKYQDELKFLYDNNQRNKFIENLALSLEGNTLLIFQRVADHGEPMYERLIKKEKTTPIYYVSGKVEGEDREEIRKIVMTHKKSITVASVGCFSTGVNIPNIDNIIVTSPTKSVTRVLQTIGRGLRKTDDKYQCTVFDIADNLQWKRKKNYTLKHFQERVRIYNKEQFLYRLYNVSLKS